MSQKDLTRVKVLERRKTKALTQMEGAAALQVSVRQMRRLERRNESGGVTALVHGNQGKPSNRRLDGKIEARIIEKFREPGFEDYGPQLIQEEMRREGISVSRETIRKLMIREDHWSARARKKARVHRLRKRRARRGGDAAGEW